MAALCATMGPALASPCVAARKAFAGEVEGLATAAVVVTVVLAKTSFFVTVAVSAGAAVAESGVAVGSGLAVGTVGAVGTGVVVGGTEAGVGAGGAPGSVGTGSGSAELAFAFSLISLPWSAARAENAG